MNISQLANEEEIGDYVIQLSMEEYYQTELFKSKKRFSRSTNELTKILAAINQGDVITIQKMLHITTAFHELDSGGWLPLHWAAVQPKPQVLRTVLWACYGMTLEAKTSEGETPLTLAAQAGLVENVKLLLERGASPHSTNDKNESPLLLAVRIGSYEMVAHLIVNGALVDQICLRKWTAMHEAAKVGCRDILMLLLRNGASTSKEDQNGITPLSIAAEHAQLDVLETLIVCGGDVNARANNGQSALMYAAGSGDPDCVTLLLQSGASPNAHNQTGHLPIHEAAYGGHYLVLKILIPVTSRRAIQVSGQSPVHSAAEGGHSHCLELLMENGFSVNTPLSDHISENYKDARKSPLFFAVSNGDVTCTEMLLNAGAKTNLDPLQCLLVAVRAGRYEIVKMLLARKADVNCYFTVVTNTVFPTALHYCIEDEVMMRLLLNNGYDVEKCFYCTHEDRSHTNHLSILLSSLGEKMLFCDYMGLEWMLKISGRVVRILLDYVNHVPVCSKLKRILEKQREWPEICSILGNPRSLQHLCRLVIRRQMTPKRLCDPDIMNSAPIAPRIKRYLVYDEYDLYGSLGL